MLPWKEAAPGRLPGAKNDQKRSPTIAIKLIVENLSTTTTESDLITLFSGVSRVRDVHMPADRSTGESRGHAFLAVATEAGAERAIQRLDGYRLDGSAIEVKEAPRSKIQIKGAKSRLWGEGHAGSRPKGSRRGSRARRRAL